MQLALFADVLPALSDYVERWAVAYNRPPWVSAHTATVRRQHLRRHILPEFGSVPIDRITVAAVNAWQQRFLAAGHSVAFARHVVTTFSAPLAQAQRDGLITVHPLRGLRWPRDVDARPDPYTPREMRRLLRWFEANKPIYLPLVALVCLTDMRPSEAAGLRWDDVDLDRRVVRIERSAVGRVVGLTKTRRSKRVIKVSEEVAGILARVEPRREWVCTSPEGTQIESMSWGGYHWRRACKAAGVRYRGFYRGRAGFLSASAARGANLLALSEYSGTSIRMLESHYLRWVRPLEIPGESRRRRHG